MNRLAEWRKYGWWSLPLFAVLFAVFWSWRSLPSPFESGVLVVLTRHSPTTYFFNAEGEPAGFEYDLAAEFARQQGWTLRLEVADDIDGLLSRVGGGRVHLGAAGLTITSERSGRLRFGPEYQEERELVVCGPSVKAPANLADLGGLRLEVVKGSSHAERLQELHKSNPRLQWVEMAGQSTEELLERAATGLTDCTVADSLTFDVTWNYLPNLGAAFELAEHRHLGWVLPKHADPRLLGVLDDFFRKVKKDGLLVRLRERYFGHVQRLAEADVLGILEKRTRLLPRLKAHFHRAQEETGLDWRLLAALAYQESQWDALATSPTGVRGIMMLTGETADRLGVDNRLDPQSSILGGARYLAMLRDELPATVPEPDRTWMALAAYNVGMGHLEDARRLALKLGKKPYAWHDVKDVLPHLAKSAHAGKLRLGYARGGEARTLVENVRIFYDILSRYEPAHAALSADA